MSVADERVERSLFVVRPHAKNADRTFLGEDLIDEPVLDIDAA
jgi:hypothetical protein